MRLFWHEITLVKNLFFITRIKINLFFPIKSSDKINPTLIIIDSIQTLYVDSIDAAPGSISQIRHSTEQLIRYSKNKSIPIIIKA